MENGIQIEGMKVREEEKQPNEGKMMTIRKRINERRKIVKELYTKKELTEEELCQETKKRLEELFGIPFSFGVGTIEQDIKFLKNNNEIEKVKKRRQKKSELEKKEEDLEKVEELVKMKKTITQIAKIMNTSESTINRYKKILRERGRLTGKERGVSKSTIKKQKRMKKVERIITQQEKNDEIKSIRQIAQEVKASKSSIERDKEELKKQKKEGLFDWNETILRLYDDFYGQVTSIKKFEEYLKICKEKYKEGNINQKDLESIKYATIATERYENIVFYIKLCMRFNKFEEALKFANSYANHENLSQQEKEKMKEAKLECQRLYQGMNIIKKDRNIKEATVMKMTGLSKIEVAILRKKIEQQDKKDQDSKRQEENDDGEERQM